MPNPDQFAPIGAWRSHEPDQKKSAEEIADTPMNQVNAKADDFPGQSTLAD